MESYNSSTLKRGKTLGQQGNGKVTFEGPENWRGSLPLSRLAGQTVSVSPDDVRRRMGRTIAWIPAPDGRLIMVSLKIMPISQVEKDGLEEAFYARLAVEDRQQQERLAEMLEGLGR